MAGKPAKAGYPSIVLPVRSPARDLGAVFVVGTVATLGAALALVLLNQKAAAAALVVASPFPCPPGIPC